MKETCGGRRDGEVEAALCVGEGNEEGRSRVEVLSQSLTSGLGQPELGSNPLWIKTTSLLKFPVQTMNRFVSGAVDTKAQREPRGLTEPGGPGWSLTSQTGF